MIKKIFESKHKLIIKRKMFILHSISATTIYFFLSFILYKNMYVWLQILSTFACVHVFRKWHVCKKKLLVSCYWIIYEFKGDTIKHLLFNVFCLYKYILHIYIWNCMIYILKNIIYHYFVTWKMAFLFRFLYHFGVKCLFLNIKLY